MDLNLSENKKVLFIAYYFPPMGLSGVQRSLKFTKFLPEYNWTPIILSAESNDYYAYDESLLGEISPDVLIYRTKANSPSKKKNRKFPNYSIQKFGRYLLSYFYVPDTKIKWYKKALSLAEKIIAEHNIEVILATAPPFTSLILAKELSKKYDIPYVVDYRDIWVDNPYHYYPTPFHKNKNISLEHDVLNYAERIVVTTRFAKETLIKRYRFLNHNDISIIHHGYDSSDFDNLNTSNDKTEKLIITHSGVFQDDRTPKYLLKALKLFFLQNKEAKDKIEIRFVGLMRKNHIKYIKKYNLDNNCKLYGYVTHSDSIRLISESDVLWLMMKDNVRSPGKLYEYFGARKPIFINCPKGNMRQLAVDTNACFDTDAADVKQIVAKLGEIYSLWKNDKLPVPDENYVSQFDRRKLTADLAKELALAGKY